MFQFDNFVILITNASCYYTVSAQRMTSLNPIETKDVEDMEKPLYVTKILSCQDLIAT